MASIDLKNTTLRILDGDTTPNYIVVKFGEGNLNYTEKVNRIYTLNRGILDDVRNGDETPVEVSISALWEYITGGTGSSATPTFEDALKRIGGAAAWVSTDDDPCRPYCVDLELMHSPQPYTCGDKEVITFPDFRYEDLQHDAKGASIQCSGKCNVTQAVPVHSTNSSGILS